jgi:DNA-directed RNA polymerase specialized sigma24 family protein
MNNPKNKIIPITESDDQLDDLDNFENITSNDLVSTWRQGVSLEDRRLAVQRAIQALPADQRRLIVLRFFEESSFEECARAMGIGAGECRIMYSAACLELKKLLK